MKASATSFLFVFLVTGMIPAQGTGQEKRALDHEDMARWARIAQPTLSPTGAALAYGLTWLDDDPQAVLRRLSADSETRIDRATRPHFSPDGAFLLATVKPSEAVVDSLKEEGKKGDELPGDTLLVGSLDAVAEGSASGIQRYAPLKSYATGDESGDWLVVHLDNEPPAEEPESNDEEEQPEKPGDGSPLILRHLHSGEEVRVEDVTAYTLSEDGTVVVYVIDQGGEDGKAVRATRLGREGETTLASGHSSYKGLATSRDGSAVAFLAGTSEAAGTEAEEDEDVDEDEDADEDQVFALMATWDLSGAEEIASAASEGVPGGWLVSEHRTPHFSAEADRLFFGTAPAPFESTLDDVPEDERVEVDVWNWKDPLLQPMQLVQLEQEEERNYLAVYDRARDQIVQLGQTDVPEVVITDEGNGRYALGRSDLAYQKEISWDGRYRDVYSVDLASGEATLLASRIRSTPTLSPAGRYAVWWDGDDRHWMTADLVSGEVRTLTAGIDVPLHNELDDHPQAPPPYGQVVWVEDDRGVLVYDKHDIWLVDPAGRTQPKNVTDGVGRDEGLRFRVVRTDPSEDAVPDDRLLLSAFDLQNKSAGFYRDHVSSNGRPARILMEDYAFSAPRSSEDGSTLLFTRESFTDFPDLWVASADLQNRRQVSDVNPQQDEYTWGSAELVEWTSADRETLQGILYKPDGFDSSRKYPMMVYFYERNSDGLYRHRPPAPGGSSINYSFYVSRGYLLFVPDIPYEIGYPGESALDAVVPGVLSLVDEGFVDRDRIGVQGHSWGGYQIAYMVTKTNLFAAAEAGAPVSNMTSAYGGIRWASGMSRAFQYERTQSRIGGTLWEATDEYLHNSPLFYADKIQTPLLMMHNDEDGAVPWYQGIELFNAMRRLEKPVWMLNYNGEAHGLRQEHNRKDWAIRMQQFFDHYLIDAPAPVWLEQGVPAVRKGKTLGLELVGKKPVS